MAGQVKTEGTPVLYTSKNISDFDGCLKTGIYACTGIAVSNAPVEKPYGVLAVFNADNDTTYMLQIFVQFSGGAYIKQEQALGQNCYNFECYQMCCGGIEVQI